LTHLKRFMDLDDTTRKICGQDLYFTFFFIRSHFVCYAKVANPTCSSTCYMHVGRQFLCPWLGFVLSCRPVRVLLAPLHQHQASKASSSQVRDNSHAWLRPPVMRARCPPCTLVPHAAAHRAQRRPALAAQGRSADEQATE
jgi:hypothetical protein